MAIQLDCMLHISFHYEAPPQAPFKYSPVIGGLRKVVNGKAK